MGAPTSATFGDQLRIIRSDRPFRLLLTTFVLQALATGAMLAGVDYVARWVIGTPLSATLLFVCFVAPALVVTPLWQRVGTARGKKPGYLVASLLLGGGALALVLLRSLPEGVVYACVAVVGVGYAGAQMFPLAMLADVASRTSEARTRVGLYTGVWTAGETLGLALGPATYAAVLALGGYVSSTGSTVPQSDSALTAIAIGFSLVPAALVALSFLSLRAFPPRYRDTGRQIHRPKERTTMTMDHDEIRAALQAMRARDLPTHGGRTLAYVYDSGLASADAIGREALAAFASTNGLDPTAFPSLLQMENDLVGIAGRLVDAPAGFAGVVDLRRHRVDPARRARRPRRADRTSPLRGWSCRRRRTRPSTRPRTGCGSSPSSSTSTP